MADVAAAGLLERHATFPGADTATKLKLLGVEVASFGDAFATTAGALELVYANPVTGVYKKLVVTDDATRLLGGVLVGDAAEYAALRPMAGSDLPLPAEPADLILPARSGTAGLGPAALPDDAQVCSCHAVTKGTLCTAVRDDGVTDLGGLKTCTKAGTGCGSCVPLVRAILDDEYPNEEYGISRLFIAAGPQHMSGHLALRYARSRHSSYVNGCRPGGQLRGATAQSTTASHCTAGGRHHR